MKRWFAIAVAVASILVSVSISFDAAGRSTSPLVACGVSAAATTYGTGKPGTNGIPTLKSNQPPILGQNADITVSGGLPGAAVVLEFVGFTAASLPFEGGTLLVIPFLIESLPPLDAAGFHTHFVPIPSDPTLCGVEAYFQIAFVDPNATGAHHVAMTNGLHWRLGA